MIDSMTKHPRIEPTVVFIYATGPTVGTLISTSVYGVMCQYVRWDVIYYIYGNNKLVFCGFLIFLKSTFKIVAVQNIILNPS